MIAPEHSAYSTFQHELRTLWENIAAQPHRWKGGNTYHRRLRQVFCHLVPPGKRVLEVGCGGGDLLAAVQPSDGLGIDFSETQVRRARQAHPHLRFEPIDAHDFVSPGETFDFIILSDLVNDLWDVQTVLERVRAVCSPHTRIILNYYSRLWEAPLSAAKALGLAKPALLQNWLTPTDIHDLLTLSGFEVVRAWREVLFPLSVPLVEPLFNRYLAHLWPFTAFNLTNFTLARPTPVVPPPAIPPQVSVIVPARNEAGNIPAIFARTPEMGASTELIFVEGGSSDNTVAAIEQAIAEHPQRGARLLRQTGKGKGDAVRLGFKEARGDILMILDADLTVPPEDLPRFYRALVEGKGDFINGVRLVYPMEKNAMRFFNLLGNKFFSAVFSWLLGQPVKDTLCGTKVLWKSDYETIAANRAYFGDFDPFGDFDLLFGAARLNHKIIDLPIRYRERTYGSTNISRWSHGWLLLRMVAFAARRIKFK